MRLLVTAFPYIMTIALVVVLRKTGVLGDLSFIAQSAAIETGVMDISPEPMSPSVSFDYNFQLRDLDGNLIEASQFKGKVVFINLWATWCGPCRAEMPSIQELYNEKKDDVTFIMLSFDQKSQHPKIKKYVEDKSFTFPVYTLEGPRPEILDVPSIPTTFIIKKDGTIYQKKVGAANYNTKKMKSVLSELAGGKR